MTSQRRPATGSQFSVPAHVRPEARDPKNPLTAPGGIPSLERKAEAIPPLQRGSEVLIVTGRSGAGRSRAANALEDLDWYVIDNLPPTLLLPMVGMLTPDGGGVHRLAAVVDVRSREFFTSLEDVLDELRHHGIAYRIIYMDATDQVLIRRYESNRRPHPLQGDGTLLDGLKAESELLAPLRERADEIIDTSDLSVHDLARYMRNVVADEGDQDTRVSLMSFGFKNGLPLDADQVLDVRFLQNPYWVDELRSLTGRDHPVSDYVLDQPGVRHLADTYAELIASTLEGYKRELKPFVTVAIGCTGGRHRSVAISEYIAENLRERGVPTQIMHRDMGRK